MIYRLILGSALNSVLSKILKRLFNISRPKAAIDEGHDDPGFPSSHAHMLAFIATFFTLEIQMLEFDMLPSNLFQLSFSDEVSVVLGKDNTSFCIWLFALLGGYLRVHLQRHTVGQVLAGFVSGTLGGLAWYSISTQWKTQFDTLLIYSNQTYPRLTLLIMILIAIIGWAFLAIYGKRISRPSNQNKSKDK